MAAVEEVQRQSRLGKRPIPVPKGVEVKIADGNVSVKGPKGTMERPFAPKVSVKRDGDELVVVIDKGAGNQGPQFQGLMRSLVAGMVQGCNEGFHKSLDLHGVGYRAELKKDVLTLALGLSHQVVVTIPEAVKCRVETLDEGGTKRPRIHLDSANKELLGQTAARIRSYRPPEPYKGKGVRYTGEHIRMKAGKAGAK